MKSVVPYRSLAVLTGLAGLVLAATAVAWATAPGASLGRAAALGALGLTLLHGARAAWRAPSRLPGRHRRHLLTVLSVLASEQRVREYAESCPGVSCVEALRHDWERLAAALDDGELAGAFDDLERSELTVLQADLEPLLTELAREDAAPEDELARVADDPRWAAIRVRSQRALERFRERAAGAVASR